MIPTRSSGGPTPAGPVVVARATPPGRSALAVVRLTGAPLDPVLDAIVRPLRPGPWRAGRTRRVALVDAGVPYDDGVAVVHRAPRSYTGEDLVEIALHGNPALVERLLGAAVAAGARAALPGEFTRRAVRHGRLDLVRAEAVDQIVRAVSAEGAKIARAAADGVLSEALAALREALLTCAAELEARLDWPDEDLAFEDEAALSARMVAVAREARALAATARRGQALVDGVRVAIVGPVNAGKSSLFNALVGTERALVHPTPGTTRDVVEARASVGPLEVLLYDTAGERDDVDPVEALGLALGRRLAAEVDLLLVVIPHPRRPDDAVEALLARTSHRPRVLVVNGIDRPGVPWTPAGEPVVLASALTGAGLDPLREALVAAFGAQTADGPVVASARVRDRLGSVAVAVDAAVEALPAAGAAVAAEDVLAAIAELDAATGADGRSDVLDAVFARFCIGK